VHRLGRWCAALACAAGAAHASAAIVAVDDSGATLTLDRPARRIVTLAPSLTELVFAAGGGQAVIATDALSDYPAAARRLAHVGDAARLDVERIVALKPDLVVVWAHGNTMRELDQLEAAGLRLFRLEPQRLDDVPRAIERLGQLLGSGSAAHEAAGALRDRLAALRRDHAGATPVRVFYQVWSSPLMTIGGGQMVNDVIGLCGGRNVFATLAPLVPLVSTEAVLAADPEAIFTADEQGATDALRRDPAGRSFALWRRHAALSAIRGGWLYVLNGDAISRQGPRIADGAAAICGALDEVRRERKGPTER
jgi:iron complex transport system substrate-binding protein